MYPFLRMAWQMRAARKAGPVDFFGTHESHHICWPWDLDIFMELNNGRALTLYDLGRLPLGARVGMVAALKRRGWGMTVAGSTTRYRRRVRFMERIRMTSRGLGWDNRFLYIEQAMWRQDGECAGHALIRMAVTGPGGIVPPADLVAEIGYDGPPRALPDWVTAWAEADALRPWPPMQDAPAARADAA